MRLNVEQQRIVEVEPSGHMLVKGVAGSGKTSVAIRRIQFLRENYCPEENDNVLLVTFNKTLIKYIQHQYEELENQDINRQQGLLRHNIQADIRTVDQLMYRYFMSYQKRHNVTYKIVSNSEARQFLQQSILKVKPYYENVKLLSLKNSNFLMDELDWIKACNIPDLETYQEIDRIGRANGGEGNPQKLSKNSNTREAIYRLMETYDKHLLHKGLVDFKNMNKLALQELEEKVLRPYTHILIDESQDLSKVQLKFLTLLHADKSYASIMFVADNTQSIYSQSWLGKGRPYTTIGYDMSGKARTLSKNYRTTTEISKVAYNLIENDVQIKGNVDFVQPSLIDRHGHPPIYRIFPNQKKQTEFIIDEIKKLQNDYQLRDICLIATRHNLIDNVRGQLEQAQIPCDRLAESNPNFAGDSVKLTTMHSIKGLEFKVIFLIHLDDKVIPNQMLGVEDDDTTDTEERKLLYVGMTRANELLYMSSVGKPSYFMNEINPNYMRFGKDLALHAYQSIPIPDYQLTNQIIDVNAREENVRQWMLQELVDTYGYPLDLITLEHPVQQFSKRGYVDISISIESNGHRVPYIFLEVKAFASGIEIGFDQLQSYMSANQDVRYGVVTDGVEIKIINRNGEEITDIPACQPQFLPSTKHSRIYKNLRNRNAYQYVQEVDDEKHIDIIDSMTGLTLDCDVDCAVPLIGNVAAGIPATAIQDFEDTVLLPKDWVIVPNDTYALRVTGDSMIDVGIDKGDIVIVHKQEAADNGDIVIALIDQEATMKEFMLMGGTVLLISKNKNYEPIQMNPEDVAINGKVIGVLKQ